MFSTRDTIALFPPTTLRDPSTTETKALFNAGQSRVVVGGRMTTTTTTGGSPPLRTASGVNVRSKIKGPGNTAPPPSSSYSTHSHVAADSLPLKRSAFNPFIATYISCYRNRSVLSLCSYVETEHVLVEVAGKTNHALFP